MVDEVDMVVDEVASMPHTDGMAPSRTSAEDLVALERTFRNIQERFAGQPRRLGFILDGIRDVSRVAGNLSNDELRRLSALVGRRAEFSVFLVQNLADHLPESADPLAGARARGVVAQREMLAVEGPPLRVSEVADRLDISRQAVDKRRQAGKLLAVSLGSRSHLYPRWQFSETGFLPGLEEVLQALDEHPPWARLRFFVSGNHRLGGERPLDTLRRGHLQRVIKAAEAFGEHGAA